MFPYYVLVVGAVVIGALLSASRKQGMREEGSSSQLGRVGSLVMLCLGILWFVVPAGLRYGVGEDYWRYVSNYHGIYRQLPGTTGLLDEPGIRLLAAASIWLRDDTTTFFMLASAMTVVPVLLLVFKRSPYISFSLYLFITTLAWQESFNIVRQCIAASIILWGYPYILHRQFARFSVVVVIAMLFHVSAVALLLLFFLPRRPLRVHEFTLCSLVAVGLLGSYALIEPYVDEAVLGSSYFVEEVNPLRIGLAWVPVILYWLFTRKSTLTAEGHFLANVMVVNALGAVAAMNSAYLTRVLIYTSLFACIAIPVILRGTPKPLRYGVSFGIVLIYGLAWFLVTSASSTLNPFVWAASGS